MTANRRSVLQRTECLYVLLKFRLPGHKSRQGHLDVARLARELGLVRVPSYRSQRDDPLTTTIAVKLLAHVEKDEIPLRGEDLLPFSLPGFQGFSWRASRAPGPPPRTCRT